MSGCPNFFKITIEHYGLSLKLCEDIKSLISEFDSNRSEEKIEVEKVLQFWRNELENYYKFDEETDGRIGELTSFSGVFNIDILLDILLAPFLRISKEDHQINRGIANKIIDLIMKFRMKNFQEISFLFLARSILKVKPEIKHSSQIQFPLMLYHYVRNTYRSFRIESETDLKSMELLADYCAKNLNETPQLSQVIPNFERIIVLAYHRVLLHFMANNSFNEMRDILEKELPFSAMLPQFDEKWYAENCLLLAFLYLTGRPSRNVQAALEYCLLSKVDQIIEYYKQNLIAGSEESKLATNYYSLLACLYLELRQYSKSEQSFELATKFEIPGINSYSIRQVNYLLQKLDYNLNKNPKAVHYFSNCLEHYFNNYKSFQKEDKYFLAKLLYSVSQIRQIDQIKMEMFLQQSIIVYVDCGELNDELLSAYLRLAGISLYFHQDYKAAETQMLKAISVIKGLINNESENVTMECTYEHYDRICEQLEPQGIEPKEIFKYDDTIVIKIPRKIYKILPGLEGKLQFLDRRLALCFANLASIYEKQNNYEHAEKCYNKSIELLDDLREISTVFRIRYKMGLMYQSLENEEEAKACFTFAQMMQKQLEQSMKISTNLRLESYQVNKQNPGICVIINNEIFYGDIELRYGTFHDALRLRSLFEKLAYNVDVKQDLNANDIYHYLKELAQNDEKLKHVDSLVIIILSHGDTETIHGINGSRVDKEELFALFNNKNCKAMFGKPKIFILQSCRGGKFKNK
jgi:tetratricopeptide (TPR) repeat protein